MTCMYYYVSLLPFVVLYFWWALAIFYKITRLNQEGNLIYNKALNIKCPAIRWFASSLLDCELCMESWISLLFCLMGCHFFKDNNLLLFAPICPSFSHLVKKLSQ